MIGPDAVGGQVKGGVIIRTDGGNRSIDLCRREGQRAGCQRQPVEAGRQLQHGGIAAAAHIGDDGGDGGIHIFGLFPLQAQQGGEGGLKTGIAGGEENGHRLLLRAPCLARREGGLKQCPASFHCEWLGACPDGAR
jgi:hypothetical protein